MGDCYFHGEHSGVCEECKREKPPKPDFDVHKPSPHVYEPGTGRAIPRPPRGGGMNNNGY